MINRGYNASNTSIALDPKLFNSNPDKTSKNKYQLIKPMRNGLPMLPNGAGILQPF